MLPRDCFAPHGLAMTQQTFPSGYSTPRVQSPLCFHRWLRVIVLFPLQKLSKFQVGGQEQNSASLLLSCTISSFFEYKKGVELNAFTLPEAFDCPQRINTNNSRPKWPFALLAIESINKPYSKRCDRFWPATDVSVRLILVAEIVEVSSRG